MRCSLCPSPAVIDAPLRCKEHFIVGFEARVKRTIDEHHLIPPGARIAVAVSGGKDSLAVLTLLHKWYGDAEGGEKMTAIAIDEGILGYRDRTLDEARRVCAELGVPLVIKSFEELAGKKLDEMLRDGAGHPCTLCGALRRRLLAEESDGFDVLATGHNADDEAQAVLMNIVKGNTELFPRLGPASGIDRPGMVRRVKPLYFCQEREVLAYSYIMGFARGFEECPHVTQSYRHVIRDAFNSYTQSHPGAKERALRAFLDVKAAMPPPPAHALPPCRSCGSPSSSGLCKACAVLAGIGPRKVR